MLISQMRKNSIKQKNNFSAAKPTEQTIVENLRVLFEDNHLIVVNKRSSDIVQADRTGDPVLSDIIKSYLKKNTINPVKFFVEPCIELTVRYRELLYSQKQAKRFQDSPLFSNLAMFKKRTGL